MDRGQGLCGISRWSVLGIRTLSCKNKRRKERDEDCDQGDRNLPSFSKLHAFITSGSPAAGCSRRPRNQAAYEPVQVKLKRNVHRDLDLPGLMQRTCDLPGVGSINQVIGQCKLRRIEEIENLAPQFQLTALLEFEVFEDGEVGIIKSRSTETAAGCVSE